MHIDAAYAGSAFICPEFRPLLNGVEVRIKATCVHTLRQHLARLNINGEPVQQVCFKRFSLP